jgi:hypothetical protein
MVVDLQQIQQQVQQHEVPPAAITITPVTTSAEERAKAVATSINIKLQKKDILCRSMTGGPACMKGEKCRFSHTLPTVPGVIGQYYQIIPSSVLLL